MNRLMLTTTIGLLLAATSSPANAKGPRPRGPGYHTVKLSSVSTSGKAKEVQVLLDTPHVKLSRVVLRRGTRLPDHAVQGAATIQVLAGSGVLALGAKKERLSPRRVVFLAPSMSHAVVPDAKKPLVLLVHQLKDGPRRWGRRGGRGWGRGPR